MSSLYPPHHSLYNFCFNCRRIVHQIHLGEKVCWLRFIRSPFLCNCDDSQWLAVRDREIKPEKVTRLGPTVVNYPEVGSWRRGTLHSLAPLACGAPPKPLGHELATTSFLRGVQVLAAAWISSRGALRSLAGYVWMGLCRKRNGCAGPNPNDYRRCCPHNACIAYCHSS